MTTFNGGSTISFDATFTDKTGAPMTPDRAVLTIAYSDHRQEKKKANINMSVSGNAGSANWDASVAYPSVVVWTIVATGASTITQSGQFSLTANPALAA